ncbi:hypothetical protein EST38_g5215 [Candolleomyces aberdarensis]|uniref:Mitochondrial outer membrane protein IML2 n=1 Tax=Candolleomyces aberdarensis TaxID=2316362 RepID=A0A4Q2DNX2_9AGAR|nr:hypothetical protein EST38_g5215 [Candolleomyces aberdarensis]
MASRPEHPNAALLESATKGFGFLFANDIVAAKEHFGGNEDPFHLMGLGVCSFLEAVLGMETNLVTEASRLLALSETASRKYAKAKTKHPHHLHSKYPPGMEWEILNADAVVLLGLTNALSESYMGYLQCMYALNNAHSKFTKLYKTVFPNGIPETPLLIQDALSPSSSSSSDSPEDFLSSSTLPGSSALAPPTLRNKASFSSLASVSSVSSGISSSAASARNTPPATTPATPTGTLTPTKGSFFSRWIGGGPTSAAAAASEPSLPLHHGHGHAGLGGGHEPGGVVEDLIVSGTAFGFGLFNLVFSLLPKKVQGLVGFLGFHHDRPLALRALSLSASNASKGDVHGVFSGLVLMTYYGVVLLLSGWQADEEGIVTAYEGVIDAVEKRYPEGALWILNRAKILRMTHDPDGAIRVLKDGLRPERTHSFAQADMMLYFELAWTLLAQRRYQEAADAFLKMTELNSWSHATYYFIAAGCYFSLGNKDKTQELLDAIMNLGDMKKVGGKDLPTEVFIKKKLEFYKEKQTRRGGDVAKYVESVKISPAEELAIFWNTHARIDASTAKDHIKEFASLTPRLSISSPELEELSPDSKSRDGHAHSLKSLLLGVCHKTLHSYDAAKKFLEDAVGYHEKGALKVNTWVGGVAIFEWGVSEIREVEWRERQARKSSESSESKSASDGLDTPTAFVEEFWKTEWDQALTSASVKFDKAMSYSPNTVDLSSRLDSRVSMIRDEVKAKRDKLGLKV